MKLRTLCALSLALLPFAGCAEEGPVGPERGNPGPGNQPVETYLSCNVSLRSGDLTCAAPEVELPGSVSGAILGGQAQYVYLESSGAAYDETLEIFSASVAVRNFLTQPIGTSDGTTADPDGVRVFFVNDPVVTGGTGVVAVDTADGTAEFTAADQPYIRFGGVIRPGMRSSSARVFRWSVPSTVESFSFLVGVSAKVPNEGAIEPAAQIEAVQVSTGETHTCALDKEGNAYCWGNNANGQLGIGTVGDTVPTPTPVAGGLKFKSIAAGFVHTCGVTLEGDAYCWGNAQYGRLGTGDSGSGTNITTPKLVAGGHKFTQISASSSNTCAVTEDQDGYCWGFGNTGRNGNGSLDHQLTPVPVAGEHKFSEIRSGHYHTCGLRTDGKAYCWGAQENGRLGNRETVGNQATPVAVDQGNLVFSTIAISSYSTCALTMDNDAYCWGNNGEISTRLGNGGVNETVPYPVPVLGGHKFISIAAAEFHGCAVDTTGQAWCWGRGLSGRRGDGTTAENNALEPVMVGGPQKFKAVFSHKSHTCGINLQDRIYCWGLNGSAHPLGVGATLNISLPRLVSPIAPSQP